MSLTQSQQPTSTEIASAALQLLELWSRLAHSHTMIGGGCSCGVGGVAVALADFEQDIVEYREAEAERNKRADVRELLDTAARDGESWSLSELLSHLARTEADCDAGPPAGLDTSPAQFILERVTRTLGSFEKLHGGR